MISIAAFAGAAVAEIAGCFAFWAVFRLGRWALWLIPGFLLLVLFATLLTLVETDGAGRAFAACGGIHVGASLTWPWLVEGVRPGRRDLVGAAICIVGAAVILFGPRTVPG